MNYKKNFEEPDNASCDVRALSFIPDAIMLRLQYWIKTGHKLNLNKPQRYTEKYNLINASIETLY